MKKIFGVALAAIVALSVSNVSAYAFHNGFGHGHEGFRTEAHEGFRGGERFGVRPFFREGVVVAPRVVGCPLWRYRRGLCYRPYGY